ncbi:ChbG/HpnK family deacetylase [bacterium]|nr:ChbG/HpnK family deacetylase [bacterium]
MMNKKFVLNADDFGLTKFHNQAVLEGCRNGLIRSASLIVNGDAYSEAVEISNNLSISIAVHLNIMEGKALTNCNLLTDEKGFFNKDYLYLIINQYNKEFLKQVEQEFDAQIRKAYNSGVNVERLDSHVHTHAIPQIFDITCKLADKYQIQNIRTQFERPYFCKNKNLKPINLIKVLLLEYFTVINNKNVKKYNLKTNDYILGVGYTGMMDTETIKNGLAHINEGFVECLIHPCKYDINRKDSHSIEYESSKDMSLKEYIQTLGFEL